MKKGIAIFVAAVFLLSFSGCKLTNFFKSEKQRFIGATSEALCLIFTSENPLSPTRETSDKVKAIYSNYGFNADNQTAMGTITKNYENDQEVKDTTAAALKKCSGIDVNAPAATTDTSTAPVNKLDGTTGVPDKVTTPSATPVAKPAK